ncbi:TatD family hydrolase, partial [Lactobacillus gasseri]
MLIDTHVHLNDEQYDEDLSEVISRAQQAGVDRMFVVGFDTATIERAMELIEQYDFLYAII